VLKLLLVTALTGEAEGKTRVKITRTRTGTTIVLCQKDMASLLSQAYITPEITKVKT